jgi:predicted short-subunit dehydrogenase-like oxidoreductase (DUF2520 family)
VTSRNPSTFVVGSGRVAAALAGGLRMAGVPVLGLWARRPVAARSAASVAGVAGFSPAPPDLVLEAEIILLAVADDAVGEVAERLVGTGLVGSRHVLLHCAGSRPAAQALGAVAGKVGGLGTLHPLRSVVDAGAVMRSWKGTVFGVEGDAGGKAAATLLAERLGGTPLPLASDAMVRYHAAAALASNYLVAVLDAAVALLRTSGVEGDAALAALVPLAQGALANVAQHGLAAGLTGPIRRGDAGTVERHLAAVAGEPAIAALYRQLAERTLGLAAEAGADPASLAPIRAVLARPA